MSSDLSSADLSSAEVYTPTETDSDDSTATVAKDRAARLGGSAAQAGKNVGAVARDEALNVADEASRQAKDILQQARTELSAQAAQQQQRVAQGLRSLSRELGSMAQGSAEPGVATDLAHQAAAKTGEVAQWLEEREPGNLLDEVRSFARQRPGTFLALALGAGVAAGRLGRGLKDDSSSSDPTSEASSDVPGDRELGGIATASASPGSAYPSAESAASFVAPGDTAYVEPIYAETTSVQGYGEATIAEPRFPDGGSTR